MPQIATFVLFFGLGFACGWIVGTCATPIGDSALWRNLWKRQRHIDELSPAAARLEQHAIDKYAAELERESKEP